jgi:uncharacterized Fe-S cluster-containing radical SAM superfamily protein
MKVATIHTEGMAAKMRAKIIRPDKRQILITRLKGSAQEGDLTSPVNCRGLGRVRHFKRETSLGWPENFLPIDPAALALGVAPSTMMEAEVFQNAACAWRCWYCYVPFELLGGDERRAQWVTADELVKRYSELPSRPSILDLSGGSPDLTPEWVPWTIEALEHAGLADQTYLWSDDNLSTDYVFTELNDAQRRMLRHPKYGRVCCFKGFDEESFAFNTGAEPQEFDRQFERFLRYLDLGIDLYAYVTLTGPSAINIKEKVSEFVERLAGVWEALPGRTVPLRIDTFGPMVARNSHRDFSTALEVQDAAIAVWNNLVTPAALPTLGRAPC